MTAKQFIDDSLRNEINRLERQLTEKQRVLYDTIVSQLDDKRPGWRSDRQQLSSMLDLIYRTLPNEVTP